jgi:hypothetical protein
MMISFPKYVSYGIGSGSARKGLEDVFKRMDRPDQLIFQVGIRKLC